MSGGVSDFTIVAVAQLQLSTFNFQLSTFNFQLSTFNFRPSYIQLQLSLSIIKNKQ